MTEISRRLTRCAVEDDPAAGKYVAKQTARNASVGVAEISTYTAYVKGRQKIIVDLATYVVYVTSRHTHTHTHTHTQQQHNTATRMNNSHGF